MSTVETQELSLDDLPTTVMIPATLLGQPTVFCGDPITILREMSGRVDEPIQDVINAMLSYMLVKFGVEISMPTVSEGGEEKWATGSSGDPGMESRP